jgi:GT2 family glycosyltransferase
VSTPEPRRAPRVSVVIPTHERRASVERVLRSLADQSLPPDEYEVVVAIDGSTDGTRELVDALRVPFALRSTWKPRGGRASACNAGWRVASAGIVVFLDDDMEATRELLTAHLDAHASAANLGVVGAVPIRTDGSASPVTRYVADRFNGHLRNLAAPGYEFGLRDFYSGNFSVARGPLERIGGFDESFAMYGNEDLDISLRLRAAGVRLVFSAAAVAHQHYEKDFPALARDSIEKGRTAAQLARKHPASFTELKLSQFDRGPLSTRLARHALLAATRRWPRTRDRVVRLVTWMSDRRLPGLRRAYPVVLDYLYWLGARMPADEREPVEDPARAPALGR